MGHLEHADGTRQVTETMLTKRDQCHLRGERPSRQTLDSLRDHHLTAVGHTSQASTPV